MSDSNALLRTLLGRLDAYIQSQNLNRSEARAKILGVIVREARHFRAQDLVDCVQRRHLDIGQATVYRNLPIFLACGLIQEGPTDAEGQVLYELADGEHHDHIVCLDCRQIFEFHDDAIEKRQVDVTGGLDFRVQSHRHVIYARCQRLAKAK